MEDYLKIEGHVWINNKYKGKNVVTLDGLKKLTYLLGGFSVDAVQYLSIGKGADSENQSNSSMSNEIDRKKANLKVESTNYTNDTLTFQSSFVFVNDTILQELGLFDALSGGNLFSRKVLSPEQFYPSGSTADIVYKIIFGY